MRELCVKRDVTEVYYNTSLGEEIKVTLDESNHLSTVLGVNGKDSIDFYSQDKKWEGVDERLFTKLTSYYDYMISEEFYPFDNTIRVYLLNDDVVLWENSFDKISKLKFYRANKTRNFKFGYLIGGINPLGLSNNGLVSQVPLECYQIWCSNE